MIHVEGFHKCYDQTIAASGISFDVQPGQVMGLIGPNGAGKTTTLRALTGIIQATQGELSVGGFCLRKNPIDAKHVLAYIPDDPQLFHDLTVAEHLAFIAKTYQVESAHQKIASLIEQFELTEKQNACAGELSRGMRQKLAITCGYVHDPKAILFDEPLTGLDPRGIRTLKQSILDRANAGAAIVISSHLLAMVEDICSHVMILSGGKQKFVGPIGEVRHAFQDANQGTSLEQIFFQATESETCSVRGSIDEIPTTELDVAELDVAELNTAGVNLDEWPNAAEPVTAGGQGIEG